MNIYMRIITVGFLIAGSVLGDVVVFKSNDRLTGTVKAVVDGKMTFESEVAGVLTLNMADILTFSTEESITIEKPDGSLVTTKAGSGEDGSIILDSTNTALEFTDITRINPEKPAWHGGVTAGATLNRGNTHSAAVSLDAKAQLRRESDRISLGAGYRFDNKRDQTTGKTDTIEDKWFFDGKYDYFLNAKRYIYGGLFYEKDRISNLDMRLSPGGGFGYQWVERSDFNFNTEAGLSYVHERYTKPDETREHAAIRLAYHLDKQLWDHVKAFHNLTFLPSAEDMEIFLVYADAGVQTKLVGSWIMEAKVEMEHDSEPAAGLDRNDYRYILGLGYSF